MGVGAYTYETLVLGKEGAKVVKEEVTRHPGITSLRWVLLAPVAPAGSCWLLLLSALSLSLQYCGCLAAQPEAPATPGLCAASAPQHLPAACSSGCQRQPAAAKACLPAPAPQPALHFTAA